MIFFFTGFQLRKVVATPIRKDRVSSEAEELYNKHLRQARLPSEHTFGIWKKRFPAMLYILRKDKEEYSQATVFAAAVLHNLAVMMNEAEPEFIPGLSEKTFNELLARSIDNDPYDGPADDKCVRDLIIRNFFSN